MKRLLCLLLAAIPLAGCTPKDNPDTAAVLDPVPRIIVTVPTIEGSDMTGLPDVQAALNEITVPEIGVEVELITLPAQTSSTEYPNRITTGEQIDLMVLNNENIKNYAEQDMLLPLDTLLESHGQQIREISENYASLTDGAVLGGQVFGIRPVGTTIGQCGGLWVNPELLKEVSFHYEPEKIYSLQELDTLFARMKKAYPDAYPLGQITNNYGFSTSAFFLGIFSDSLTASDPAAVLINGDSTQIVDIYETDAYREFLKYMRKWYLDGYIYPDSAITTATSIGLYQAGLVLSVPQSGSPYMLSEADLGSPIVPLRLSPIREGRGGNTGIFWTVPVTSREPEAAMKFLNMMFSDERVVNLLSWGILGKDYSLNEDGSLSPLEDRGYINPLGMYGDQRLCYDTSGEEKKDALAAFSEKAEHIFPQYANFSFDSSGLIQELLEIEKVESQYVKLLEAGCVDLDTAYPEFIGKLYDAGLQHVIDEKQRQLDAFLAENS